MGASDRLLGTDNDEGISGKSGTKKDWIEMRDSRARATGEDGERKERRTGRLLMWAREERSWWPRALRSSRARVPPLLLFLLSSFPWGCFRFLAGDAMAEGKGRGRGSSNSVKPVSRVLKESSTLVVGLINRTVV